MLTREKLKQLEGSFDAFISPLLDEDDVEDVRFAWEFKKFLHSKRLKVLTSERETLKRWKEQLLAR